MSINDKLEPDPATKDVEKILSDPDAVIHKQSIENALWGIYWLTFFSQVLAATLFWLNNPGAAWQIFVSMVIMAAQGTIIGGAIKILLKRLDYIKEAYENEKDKRMQEKNKNLLLGMQNKRLNEDITSRDAELIATKKKLYQET